MKTVSTEIINWTKITQICQRIIILPKNNKWYKMKERGDIKGKDPSPQGLCHAAWYTPVIASECLKMCQTLSLYGISKQQ